MQSPLKALERLSEELKLERQKASTALQDRARLRVEVESLKQAVDEKNVQNSSLHAQCEAFACEVDTLQLEMVKLQVENDSIGEDLFARNEEEGALYREKLALQNENELLRGAVGEIETEVVGLRIKVNSLEVRSQGKEGLMASVKAEIQELRTKNAHLEAAKLDVFADLAEKGALLEALQARLEGVGLLESGYSQTRCSNEDLRSELEQALLTSAAHLQQIRSLNQALTQRTQETAALEERSAQLERRGAALGREVLEAKGMRDQFADRVEAEIGAAEAAREQAAAAARGRDFLDQQLGEVREAHRGALARANACEEQLAHCRNALVEARSEAAQAGEKLGEAQALQQQAEGMQDMVREIDALRSQLNEVRRQLIKRDIQEETGVLAPQSLIQHEEQTRAVYEGIIRDLRQELEQANSAYFEVTRRCEAALAQSGRVEQLQEEVLMYKEMGKRSAAESQNAALSVSHAAERTAKFAHERQGLQLSLHRTETELGAARTGAERLKAETADLRVQVKGFHSATLGAENKAAGLSAAAAHLQVALEESRQAGQQTSMELDRAQQRAAEAEAVVAELRGRLGEASSVRDDNASLGERLATLRGQAGERERELLLQVEGLRHAKATMQSELGAALDSAQVRAEAQADARQEAEQLRAQLREAGLERDALRREVGAAEHSRAQGGIVQLRRDLAETVADWGKLGKTKHSTDHALQRAQAESSKEREKNAQLRAKAGALEDQLRGMSRELSVLRGIDVYQGGLRVGMQQSREAARSTGVRSGMGTGTGWGLEKSTREEAVGAGRSGSGGSGSSVGGSGGGGLGTEGLASGTSRRFSMQEMGLGSSGRDRGGEGDRGVNSNGHSTYSSGIYSEAKSDRGAAEEEEGEEEGEEEELYDVAAQLLRSPPTRPLDLSRSGGSSLLGSGSPAERQELLRRREGRRAIREGQLRERLVRSGVIPRGFGSSPSQSAWPYEEEEEWGGRTHTGSASSASSPTYARSFSSTAPSRLQLSKQGGGFRPAKTDFDRARKLLSM